MDTESLLYSQEERLAREFVDVPRWIDMDINLGTLADIRQGGCESGAYMPAVTYYQAGETMSAYGDEVFAFLEHMLDELPEVPEEQRSWSGMACFYLSSAVELWTLSVADVIAEELEDERFLAEEPEDEGEET